MYYDMLLGHIGLYDGGEKLHSVKEVADFIHTQHCGYIAEADGIHPTVSKSFCTIPKPINMWSAVSAKDTPLIPTTPLIWQVLTSAR